MMLDAPLVKVRTDHPCMHLPWIVLYLIFMHLKSLLNLISYSFPLSLPIPDICITNIICIYVYVRAVLALAGVKFRHNVDGISRRCFVPSVHVHKGNAASERMSAGRLAEALSSVRMQLEGNHTTDSSRCAACPVTAC